MRNRSYPLVVAAVMASAFVLAACGSKKASQESSASPSSEAGTSGQAATEEEPSSGSLEESTVGGYVQSVDGKNISLEIDDGRTMRFDMSKAVKNPAWDLMEGDYVEITYEGSEPAEGMAIKKIAMIDPFEYMAEGYEESPYIYARVDSFDDSSLSVTEVLDMRDESNPPSEEDEEGYLGESYTIHRAPYEILLTEDGLEEGVYAQIYYLGELDDSPVSYFVCTEDMEDSYDGTVRIKGTLDKVEDGIVYLETSDGKLFKFNTNEDEDLLKSAADNKGREVEIAFSDSILMRVMAADSIEKA